MKKLKLHEEQAGILAIEVMKAGIPQEYLPKIMQIADAGYLFGRADQLTGRPENEKEYRLESFEDANTIAIRFFSKK